MWLHILQLRLKIFPHILPRMCSRVKQNYCLLRLKYFKTAEPYIFTDYGYGIDSTTGTNQSRMEI